MTATKCGMCDAEARFLTPYGRLCFAHATVIMRRDDDEWIPIASRLSTKHASARHTSKTDS